MANNALFKKTTNNLLVLTELMNGGTIEIKKFCLFRWGIVCCAFIVPSMLGNRVILAKLKRSALDL